MRLALIGCGERIRTSVLPVIAGTPGVRITALADPDPESLAATRVSMASLGFKDTYQIQQTGDHRTVPTDCVDACIIASPHSFHHQQAQYWLSRTKPVFVEKPLACGYRAAAALVRKYDRTGLTVCDPRRFRPDLLLLSQLLRAGVIGRLLNVEYEDNMMMRSRFSASWRNDICLSGGGALLDLGCHVFSTLTRMCSDFAGALQVKRTHLFRRGYNVETEASVWLSTRTGLGVHIELRLVQSQALSYERVTISGDAGWIKLLRQRGSENHAQIEIKAGRQARVFSIELGNHFDGEGIRSFLAAPTVVSDCTRVHLSALRLISQAYKVARISGERRHAGRAEGGEQSCSA